MIMTANLMFACQTGVIPISQREFLNEKEGKSPNLGHRRPVEETRESSSEIYIKREDTVIAPKETENFSGSLFALARIENHLFVDPPRGKVGEAMEIAIQSRRTEEPALQDKDKSAPLASASNGTNEAKGGLDELAAALPKLEPGDSKPKIPKSLKMNVIRQYENGDVQVEAIRASKNEWDANTIRVTGRIPRAALTSMRQITSADLTDIIWDEQQDANSITRESSEWQDEYTLRWAGFDEARSKTALELEAKRKELQQVKDKLLVRVQNLGKERGVIAQERERLQALKAEANQKIDALTKKIADQAQTIEQQKETLLKLESNAIQPAKQETNRGERPTANP